RLQLHAQLEAHQWDRKVWALAPLTDGGFLAAESQPDGSKAFVRDLSASLSQKGAPRPCDAAVRSLALDAREDWLLTAQEKGTARLTSRRTEVEYRLEGLEGKAKAVAVSPDGQLLLVGCDGGNAFLYRRKDGTGPTLVTRLAHSAGHQVRGVAISPDGRLL